jgi:L-cystine transport system permease protein
MDFINIQFAIEHFPEVLKGVPMTLTIAIISMILGILLGLLVALVRIYKVPVLSQIAVLYISFIRGTPLVVQLYVFFYGVPELLDLLNNQFGTGFDADLINPLWYALIAYTINTTANQAEILRASLNAIHSGQMEAALSVGMTTPQALRRIVIPQAFTVALPDLGNTFINLIKATSLAFAVKVIEIMAIAKIVANDGYNFVEMYLVAALVYWVICIICELLLGKFEKYIRRTEVKAA